MGETTTVHLPLVGGLDEKLSAIYLDAASRQASVTNANFTKVGVLDKRDGLAHLATATIAGGVLPALATGTRVVGWSRSSLSILCSTGLYQYVAAPVGGATTSGVVGVSQLPGVVASRRHITTGDQFTAPTLVDLNYGGQLLRISVFYDSAYNIQAAVYDVASGNMILEPTQVYANSGTFGGGTIPRLVTGFDIPGIATGQPRTLIAIQDLSTTITYAVQYTPSTNTFSAPAAISPACSVVDVVPYEDDPAFGYLVLYNSSPTNMRLVYRTSAGIQATVDQAISGGGHVLDYPCYIAARYGQNVFSFWATSLGGLRYNWAYQRAGDHVFASGMAAPMNYSAVATPAGVSAGPVHLGTNKVYVSYWSDLAQTAPGPNTPMLNWVVLSYTAPNINTWANGRYPLGLIPSARPFVVAGEVYQVCTYDLDYYKTASSTCQQITSYLCKISGVSDSMSALGTVATDVCRPVATIAPRTTSNNLQKTLDFYGFFHTGLVSTTQRSATQVAIGLKTNGDSAGVAGPSWAVDFNWDSASIKNLYQANELGAELSISAGVPFVADGQIAFEDGWFNFPEFTYVTLTGAATGLVTGTYTFAVCYRAVDSSGLVHRSAPFICPPTAVVNGAAGPVVKITPPLASYRDALASSTTQGKVYADIYITSANGGTFYYLDSVVTSNLITWPKAVSYSVSAAISGPTLTSPLLYTTGGIMDRVNPPASRIQTTHQSRKAIVDETLQQVWFSTEFVPGEAPGFNEALTIPFPEGGDITAISSLEGKFVCFKARSIWIMDGQGPAITGLGSSWTQPESVSTDVGAKSWQSVVSTPKGLLFQGSDGAIYLLGRDLQVTQLGKNVIDRTTAFPNIVSASLVSSSTQVRFVCTDTGGTSQIAVIYDYLLDQWCVHQYAQLGANVASTCVSFEGTPRYTVLTTDGKLFQERLPTDAARYLDADSSDVNHFVTTTITVPWVKAQTLGMQRMKRVQFFGQQMDDCGLNMGLAYNYVDAVQQSAVWTSTQLKALNVRGQVETVVAAEYSKGMSVQMTISDTAGTAMTNGAGMRFAAVALELQSLGQRYKLLGSGARR